MIDRAARNRLAEMVRHLATGLITNDAFEDGLLWSYSDPVIFEVMDECIGGLYTDFHR